MSDRDGARPKGDGPTSQILVAKVSRCSSAMMCDFAISLCLSPFPKHTDPRAREISFKSASCCSCPISVVVFVLFPLCFPYTHLQPSNTHKRYLYAHTYLHTRPVPGVYNKQLQPRHSDLNNKPRLAATSLSRGYLVLNPIASPITTPHVPNTLNIVWTQPQPPQRKTWATTPAPTHPPRPRLV